jgi:hypothetical protein
VLNLGGMKKKVKIILEVTFVMGDQKSQDTLCGRKKSYGGGTARIHRRCMCSSMHASDSSAKCKLVSEPILDRLRDISFEDQPSSAATEHADEKLPPDIRGNVQKRKDAMLFIKRRSRLAREILGRTHTMHAIRNAFDNVRFGSNQNGMHFAALDDAPHFCNSGFFLCMGKAAYLRMQGKEREDFESLMLAQLRGVWCSVRGDHPRGRTSIGFTNMTLLTADEKVGMLFTMLLAVHNNAVKATMEKAATRQHTKHMPFPIPKEKLPPPPTEVLTENTSALKKQQIEGDTSSTKRKAKVGKKSTCRQKESSKKRADSSPTHSIRNFLVTRTSTTEVNSGSSF